MSMYENYEKDNLFDEIKTFLESHSIGTLLEIVSDAVKSFMGEF